MKPSLSDSFSVTKARVIRDPDLPRRLVRSGFLKRSTFTSTELCYSAIMSELVVLEIVDRVAALTLNRPDRRNALSQTLMTEFEETLVALTADESVHAVVLAGEGPVFCAGIDLEDISQNQEQAVNMVHQLGRIIRRVRRLPCPVIAVVQGTAIGAGCAIMLAADFIITHPEATFGYPPQSSMLSPSIIAPWLMQRIGPARARAQLLHGGKLSGQEAFDQGMITHLVPADQLPVIAQELADHFRQGSAGMTAQLKQVLNELDGSLDDAALDRAMMRSAESVAQRFNAVNSEDKTDQSG